VRAHSAFRRSIGDRFLHGYLRMVRLNIRCSMKYPARHLAFARFAGKGSVSKAFGNGNRQSNGWRNIDIRKKREWRTPVSGFSGPAQELAAQRRRHVCPDSRQPSLKNTRRSPLRRCSEADGLEETRLKDRQFQMKRVAARFLSKILDSMGFSPARYISTRSPSSARGANCTVKVTENVDPLSRTGTNRDS